MPLTPCLECGQLATGPRCEQHRLKYSRPKPAHRNAGYDSAWRRLSAKARRLQPWCSDCHATTDLQADHTPAAWARHDRGLPVRLQDIDVVCGPCNRARGAARGENITHKRPANGALASAVPSATTTPSRAPEEQPAATQAPGGRPLATRVRSPRAQGGLSVSDSRKVYVWR